MSTPGGADADPHDEVRRLTPYRDLGAALAAAREVLSGLPLTDGPPIQHSVDELIARLLLTLRAVESGLRHQSGRTPAPEASAVTDPVTGLPNRAAWMLLLDVEDARCERLGFPAAIVRVDVGTAALSSGNGDAVRHAAAAVRSVIRTSDVAARIAAAQFGVLAVHCPPPGEDALAARIQGALVAAGVTARVGAASRQPVGGLRSAWERADDALAPAVPAAPVSSWQRRLVRQAEPVRVIHVDPPEPPPHKPPVQRRRRLLLGE